MGCRPTGRACTSRGSAPSAALTPSEPPAAVLADLARHTPGDEGKWFAAAKSAKLFDEAIALANGALQSEDPDEGRPGISLR